MKHALVTGGAGFIGSHLADALVADGWRVTVFDSFDPFYDPAMKERNVAAHLDDPRYTLVRGDLRDGRSMRALADQPYDVIVHLAARAGVRPSIEDPVGYQDVNVAGTQQVLELARRTGVRQVVFASSSSVYGVNPRVPWREDDYVLQPISPYASTKVSGELLGHVYSHLYGIRFLALRFFTVYGPRQRPDLAIHKFARLMLAARAIPVYGDGTTSRDYTYVDDVIRGVRAAMAYTGSAYEVINLGNMRPVSLQEMIAGLEAALGMKASIERHPEQPGDVPRTWANIDKARALLGYEPATPYQDGVARFADWLRKEAPTARLR
jgi:UDP-glucuronate 4-epimerase